MKSKKLIIVSVVLILIFFIILFYTQVTGTSIGGESNIIITEKTEPERLDFCSVENECRAELEKLGAPSNYISSIIIECNGGVCYAK